MRACVGAPRRFLRGCTSSARRSHARPRRRPRSSAIGPRPAPRRAAYLSAATAFEMRLATELPKPLADSSSAVATVGAGARALAAAYASSRAVRSEALSFCASGGKASFCSRSRCARSAVASSARGQSVCGRAGGRRTLPGKGRAARGARGAGRARARASLTGQRGLPGQEVRLGARGLQRVHELVDRGVVGVELGAQRRAGLA